MHSMIVQLIYNVAILIALSSIYGLLIQLKEQSIIWFKVLSGILFGVIAIAGMTLPMRFVEGIIYDGRSIVMVLAGLFGGGTASIISVVIAGLYRLNIGGDGVWAGLMTIVSCASAGLVFRRLWNNEPHKLKPQELYALGIIAHLLMLASQLLLPWSVSLETISQIWLPVMLVFPAATMLMGLLLGNAERQIVIKNQLNESKNSLNVAQEIVLMGSWEYDLKTNIPAWSSNMPIVFGINPLKENIVYKDFTDRVHKDDRHLITETIERIINDKVPVDVECRIITMSDELRYIHNRVVPIVKNDHVVTINGVSHDITQAILSRIELKKNLDEKEILLKEVHHRVKNNLNIIISLLNLQSRMIQNKDQAIDAFNETRNRIFSMSLVHEKLYKSEDFSHIDMKDYIYTITNHYIQVANSGQRIDLSFDLDSIFMEISDAIPCGLIINELITNAFKHAFPGDHKGKIVISLKETADQMNYMLVISDNGIGINTGIDFNNPPSLGLKIIKLLTDQLNGTLNFHCNNGTIVTILFPK